MDHTILPLDFVRLILKEAKANDADRRPSLKTVINTIVSQEHKAQLKRMDDRIMSWQIPTHRKKVSKPLPSKKDVRITIPMTTIPHPQEMTDMTEMTEMTGMTEQDATVPRHYLPTFVFHSLEKTRKPRAY